MLCLQAYNSTADRLQLIPTTAKRAEGAQFEAQVDRTGAAASEIVSLDLKGAVKPALTRLRCKASHVAFGILTQYLLLIYICTSKLAACSDACSVSVQSSQQEELAFMTMIQGNSSSGYALIP